MTDDTVHLNGVDGETGQPLVGPLSIAEAAERMPGRRDDPSLKTMEERIDALSAAPSFGLPPEIDPHDVAQAGWAIVFADGTPHDVRRALDPLVERRRASVPADRFRILEH